MSVDSFSSMLENVSAFLASDPTVLLLQVAMITCAFLIVYAVLFVTRDVILRSHSFLFQVLCILISAIPVAGILIYLLIRPSTTLFDRSLMRKLSEIQGKLHAHAHPKKEEGKKKQK